ncbi:MAG: extracellular solute-binding protein [Nitrospinota bacterium]|nr:MAG: extracellular solute-binding protein [Nitrospinota bacterium]
MRKHSLACIGLGSFFILMLALITPALAAEQLTVIMGLGEVEWQVMREQIFPPFEAQYQVKIQAFQAEASDTIKKLEAMHRARKMRVDLITQDNMQLAPLVEKGLVEDLSAYRSFIPPETAAGIVRVGEFDGRLYFMPYRPNVEITFYNEPKFREYGLTPPETWEELLQVARTFYEREGVGRVAIKGTLDANTTTQLFDFIRSAGGDPLVLNDAGSIEAFQFLRRLYPYLSPETKKANWNTMNKYLANESVYLGQNWPFGIHVIVRQAGKKEIKAYHGWRGPVKESHVLGGEVIGIPKGAPHRELAIKFMQYLMSPTVQKKLLQHLGWPSFRPHLSAEVADWQRPYYEAVNQALAHAEPRPNVSYWATVEKALNNAFREIVMEGAPVKPTLDRYHQMLERAKKR